MNRYFLQYIKVSSIALIVVLCIENMAIADDVKALNKEIERFLNVSKVSQLVENPQRKIFPDCEQARRPVGMYDELERYKAVHYFRDITILKSINNYLESSALTKMTNYQLNDLKFSRNDFTDSEKMVFDKFMKSDERNIYLGFLTNRDETPEIRDKINKINLEIRNKCVLEKKQN